MKRLGIDRRHQEMQVMRVETQIPISAGNYSEVIVPVDEKDDWEIVLISAVTDTYVNWAVDATENKTASGYMAAGVILPQLIKKGERIATTGDITISY